MSTFDESKIRRDGEGKFANKGPAAEADGVALSDPARPLRPAPLKRANLGASNRSAREMVRLAQSGDLDLDPPYQRGSVWTTDQKRALVKSYMMGVPIPAVIVNHRPDPKAGEAWYHCVDGKQRIEATRDWYEGKLEVPAHWFPESDVESSRFDENGDEWVTHQGLTEVAQRRQTNRWTIPVAEGDAPDERGEAEIFTLVNGGGTAQTPEDMERAAKVARGER